MARNILILVILLGAFTATGQITITRPTIGSFGADATVSSSITYMFNGGESSVETTSGISVEITQGFEQPPYARDTSSIPNPGGGGGAVDTASTSVASNAFSPNGDGVNDTWYIDRFESPTDNTVTIYNRWGDEVWKATNYDNSSVAWDGTNNGGTPLTSGTYFYVITITNSNQTLSGWVQLTKE